MKNGEWNSSHFTTPCSKVTNCNDNIDTFQHFVFVMERPSIEISWGLTVSMFSSSACPTSNLSFDSSSKSGVKTAEGCILMVGCIGQECIGKFTKYSSQLPSSSDAETIASSLATLLHEQPGEQNGEKQHKSLLCTGDAIISLNGRRIDEKPQRSFAKIVHENGGFQSSLRLILQIQRNPTLTPPALHSNTDPKQSYQVAEQAFFQYRAKEEQQLKYFMSTMKENNRVNFPSLIDKSGKESLLSPQNLDFWSSQGYDSFLDWLQSRKLMEWKPNYSWNRQKRKRLEEASLEWDAQNYNTNATGNSATSFINSQHSDGNHLSIQDSSFEDWLRIRKHQWKILRRKRQRRAIQQQKQQQQNENITITSTNFESSLSSIHGNEKDQSISSSMVSTQNINDTINTSSTTSITDGRSNNITVDCKNQKRSPTKTDDEMFFIDSWLEEQEQKHKANLSTFDLAFIFDAALGTPDDVIFVIFQYLPPSEHGALLCLSRSTSQGLQNRQQLWRQLCLASLSSKYYNWTRPPRRPRKPWHALYLSQLHDHMLQRQKQSDDLLMKLAGVLQKSDCVIKVQTLVARAEKRFGFCVDYVSGVVCERNSLINLAVIHGRVKVVKWLFEIKGKDEKKSSFLFLLSGNSSTNDTLCESTDRGGFTPLLNAAYNGHKVLVRYLLSQGCNRNQCGVQHSSKPLAPPGTPGKTAEEWAKDRGHHEIAQLIREGL